MIRSFLLYITLITTLVFSSCKATLFDALPGTAQDEFPEQLRGSYYITTPKQLFRKRSETDTLFLSVLSNTFTMQDSSQTEVTRLDSAHHLQQVLNKYYVMAVENNNYPDLWELTFLQPGSRGIKLYPIVDDGTNLLQQYFSRKFVEINNSGDSVFTYQTNDSSLVTYYEKVLTKKDAIELSRFKNNLKND